MPAEVRCPAPSCDVAVVGAGPVGATLGLLLARSGRRVQIFESRFAPYPGPRAVHLDDQAARILQGVGVMGALADRVEVMDAYEWRSAAGETLLRIEPAAPPGPGGWPSSLMFCQVDLEESLNRRLAESPGITLHRGWTVTALTAAHDSVQVSVTGPGGLEATTGAAWVAGCDGAQGPTRDLAGLGVTDLGFGSEWLVVDVVPHAPRRWRPLNIQVCDPRRPTTAVSGGPGRRRFEFMRLPGEAPADLAGAAVAWRLLAPWGLSPADAAIERQALYRFEARVAQRWQAGRILLAGDAAHQMPPFAGQGLCAGLRDAANLAWKLDAVIGGAASPALIETYHSERAPQAAAEIEFSVELGKLICALDPVAADRRDADMARAAATTGPIPPPPLPPLGPGCTLGPEANAGHPVPQGTVASQGRRGRFDDVTASAGRWVLLGDDAQRQRQPHLEPELRAWFTSIGGVIWRLGPGDGPGSVADVDGTYRRWFDDLGAGIALQRPDGALFAAGPAQAANDIVRAARRALTRSPRDSA